MELQVLLGKRLTGITEDNDCLKLGFEGGQWIRISIQHDWHNKKDYINWSLQSPQFDYTWKEE